MNLKDYNMVSNPFDLLTGTALELARESIFISQRYKNEDSYLKTEDFEYTQVLIQRIKKCLDVLENIPDEERETCRINSASFELESLASHELSRLTELFPNEYTRCVVYMPSEMEQIIGLDSDIINRHVYLKNVVISGDNDLRTPKKLHSCIDYLNSKDLDDYINKYSVDRIYAEHIENLQKKYNLTEMDCEWLLSYNLAESKNNTSS